MRGNGHLPKGVKTAQNGQNGQNRPFEGSSKQPKKGPNQGRKTGVKTGHLRDPPEGVKTAPKRPFWQVTGPCTFLVQNRAQNRHLKGVKTGHLRGPQTAPKRPKRPKVAKWGHLEGPKRGLKQPQMPIFSPKRAQNRPKRGSKTALCTSHSEH